MPITSTQTKMLLLNHLGNNTFLENICRFNIMSFVKKEDEAKEIIKKAIVQTYAITMNWKLKQLRIDLRKAKKRMEKNATRTYKGCEINEQGFYIRPSILDEVRVNYRRNDWVNVQEIRPKGKEVKTTMKHLMKSPTTLFLKFPKMRYTSHNKNLFYPIGWYAYKAKYVNIFQEIVDKYDGDISDRGVLFFALCQEDIMNTFADGSWTTKFHTDKDFQYTDEEDWLDERFEITD